MERTRVALIAALALAMGAPFVGSATAETGEAGRGFFDAGLPASARGELTFEASDAYTLFLGGGPSLAIEGTAARILVERTSSDVQIVYNPVTGGELYGRYGDPSVASSEYADATVSLARGGATAEILAEPTGAGHVASLYAPDSTALIGAGESFFVGRDVSADVAVGSAPYEYRLSRTLDGPLFNASAPGLAQTLTGTFQVFLYDVDLAILSGGKETVIETGARDGDSTAALGAREVANALVTFEGATLTIRGAEVSSVYAPAFTVGVTGAAVLRDAVGGFNAGDATYESPGRDVALRGALAYDFQLVEGRTDRALVEVAGDLESITLDPATKLDAARYLGPAAKAVAVGGGALLLAAGALLLVRHRAPLVAAVERVRPHARAYEGDPGEAAVLALEAGDAAAAAKLFEAALEKSPDDVVLLVDYGTTLERLGRTMRARDVYERAVRVAPGRGEAHYYYSRVLAALGLTASALPHLQRALTLDPRLRDMARRDPGFRPLADHPTFAAIVA